jgi:hypothetical protein
LQQQQQQQHQAYGAGKSGKRSPYGNGRPVH